MGHLRVRGAGMNTSCRILPSEAMWLVPLICRGRRGRPDFAHLQDFALSDYLEAVLIAIDQFDQPPVLVGHSMGGQLAWRASEERDVAGLVLMASVPPTGLAAPAMELLVSRPSLFWDVAAIHAGEAGSIESVQAALFSDTTDKALVEKYAARMQHESQAAVAGLYLPFMPNILSIWGRPSSYKVQRRIV